jgi:cytochrome c-type biogenesis protein
MTFSLPVIYAAGLLSFASPCVLPLIPVYLGTLAGGASPSGTKSRRVVGMAVAFAAGISGVFVALGAFAATVGVALEPYRAWLLGIGAVLLLVFGLRALGVVRFAVLDRDVRPLLARVGAGGSFIAAFALGAGFALGWSPCVGPLLASLLTYAATQANSSWQGAGYLAVYAAGFSTPLIAFALIATRLAGLVRQLTPFLSVFERVTGAALVAFAIFTGYDAVSQATTPKREDHVAPSPRAHAESVACEASGAGAACKIDGPAEAPPLFSQSSIAGRHMLEFVSHHCPACERMRPVLERVQAACAALDTPLVTVDVGTVNGRATALHHAVRGTPTFVFVGADGKELDRVIGETKMEHLIKRIQTAFGLQCRLDDEHQGEGDVQRRKVAG